MKQSILFLTSLFLPATVLAQTTMGGPASDGEKIVVISPMVGKGTADDPRRPAVMPNLGKGGKAPADAANYRYVVTDDGQRAIVEMSSPDKEALTRAVADKADAIRVFDPGASTKAAIESELTSAKRDFTW